MEDTGRQYALGNVLPLQKLFSNGMIAFRIGGAGYHLIKVFINDGLTYFMQNE